MKAKPAEFFTHCQTGNAEPTRSLGLVALGQFDRLAKKLPLGSLDERGVGVRNFARG